MNVSFAVGGDQNEIGSETSRVAHGVYRLHGVDAIRSPGQIDESALAADREVITAGLERKSQLVLRITTALERLANGQYGLVCSVALKSPAPAAFRALDTALSTLSGGCGTQARRRLTFAV